MNLYLAIIDSDDRLKYMAFDREEDAIEYLNTYMLANFEYYETDGRYGLSYKDWDDITDFAEQLSIQEMEYRHYDG